MSRFEKDGKRIHIDDYKIQRVPWHCIPCVVVNNRIVWTLASPTMLKWSLPMSTWSQVKAYMWWQIAWPPTQFYDLVGKLCHETVKERERQVLAFEMGNMRKWCNDLYAIKNVNNLFCLEFKLSVILLNPWLHSLLLFHSSPLHPHHPPLVNHFTLYPLQILILLLN